MPLGRKVADIYAELNLDKDELRRAMAAAGGEMGADADRLGRSLGDRMSKGMAGQVEQLSARLAKARLAEQKATDAVALAQARLTEAEGKGNVEGSRLLALQQRLSQAEASLAIAHDNTAKATTRHADAERRLAADLENLGKATGPAADRAGQDAGDKLSQGIHLALIRNSPLIAAGIGAALAAGAPVAIAGATVLFAGLGVAAAAQSDKVRQAWVGTWDAVKSGAQQDASVLQSALTGAAGQITRAFQQMRPELQGAFSAAAPEIQTFTESITRAAQNALPGLVNAVKASGPVMDGLGNLVQSVGTGVGQFFDGLSKSAPDAGRAFTALGGMIQNLFPILSTLLGSGTKVASVMLPALSGALGGLGNVLDFVAPVLPTVIEGFAGFQIGEKVAGWMGGAASAVGKVGDAMGGSEADAGAFSSALSFMGDHAQDISDKAGPLLGAAISAVTIVMSAATEQAQTWTDALRKGGSAADEARAQMNDLGTAFQTSNSSWGGAVAGLVGFNAQQYLATSAIGQTKDALKAQWEAMSPLQQAQSKVAEWTATLSDRLQHESASSDDVQAAFRRLAVWTDKEAEAQRQLEMATKGVTQAMVDQANQARGRTDAAFAYQNALNSTEDATTALADAQGHLHDADEKTRTSQEDVSRAALALQEAYKAQADAAQDAATSDLPASMDDNQKAIIGAKGALDELNRLMAQGITLDPSLEAYRQQLIQITGQTDGASLAQAQLTASLGELGYAVKSVPGEKYITIDAPTDALVQKLKDLGFWVVTLPDGSVTVEARTDEAKANIGNLSTLLTGLGAQTTTPTISADITPLQEGWAVGMNLLGVLGDQQPRPVAGLETGPLNAAFDMSMADIGVLTGQRPTPIASLNNSPFLGSFNNVMSNLATVGAQHPTPTVSVNDNASGLLGSILAKENALYNKQITITTVNWLKTVLASGGPVTKAASGRIVGPGTGTSDSVPAVGPGGAMWALSNGEWVVRERSSRLYGAAKMAAINAGIAQVTVPSGRSPVATDTGSPGSQAKVQGGAVGGNTYNLTLNVSGVDLSDSTLPRKWLTTIRDGLVKIERERR